MKASLILLLSLGFFVSLQAQTIISLTSRGDLSSSIGSASGRNDNQVIGSRASFGFEVAHFTKANQAVLTGIEYSIAGTDTRDYLIFGDQIDPITGPFDSTRLTVADRHDFIALPLGYRWYGAKKKWRFYGQGSLIPMAYLRTIYSRRLEGEKRQTYSERTAAIKDIHLAVSVGGGLERAFENGWTVGLQPTARVHLTALSTGPLTERLWTAGLQLNIGKQIGFNSEN